MGSIAPAPQAKADFGIDDLIMNLLDPGVLAAAAEPAATLDLSTLLADLMNSTGVTDTTALAIPDLPDPGSAGTPGTTGPGGPAPYVRPRRRSGAFRSLILLAIVIVLCSTAWHAMNGFFFFNIPWFPIAVIVAIVLLVTRHRRR